MRSRVTCLPVCVAVLLAPLVAAPFAGASEPAASDYIGSSYGKTDASSRFVVWADEPAGIERRPDIIGYDRLTQTTFRDWCMNQASARNRLTFR